MLNMRKNLPVVFWHNHETGYVIIDNTIKYKLVSIDEIIQLRHDILIVGTDRISPVFDCDHDDSTRHFGAFTHNRNICCLSWMKSEFESKPAMQLRGMATHQDYRGTGVGRALLEYSEQHIAHESNIKQFWCNARTGAVKFYQKQGWAICSDEFMISGVGPHYKMKKEYQADA